MKMKKCEGCGRTIPGIFVLCPKCFRQKSNDDEERKLKPWLDENEGKNGNTT